MRFRRLVDGPSTALATATGLVYLLVVVGATASLADAAASCSGWPLCTGSLTDPAVAIALTHHALALVTGIVLLAAVVITARATVPRRVGATALAALLIYPAQIGFGALLATDAAPLAPGLHLGVGLGIFGLLVLSLAWQLEHETGSTDQPLTDEDVDPVEPEGPSEPVTPLSERPLSARLKARAGAYFRLMKPRLMWLLCLVAAAAMALAAGTSLQVGTIVFTLGGGVLAIGASGTFNHVLEREKDKKMSRTNDRPLATHQIPKRNAVAFGLALAVLSVLAFLQLNPLTAMLGLTAIIFYSVVYTLILKPNTVQNTVIGGAAGSLPALIGWAAVTGRIGVAGVLLAGVIFVWTPAHFYNLALAYKEDYARGGFPMMPVVRGETTTRKHILLWAGATLATTTLLIWVAELGWLAALTTVSVGAVFVWATIRLHREQTEQAAFRAFHSSNAYLGLLLIAIVVDTLAV
ncbi:protoheme IX farnesyltransferase [Halovenus sp. WSH3]|uniref:Protoheme IX farnesyltransferase n=1 Tax=Halovenus carboxidivorans TaxID=2692199 RepID=A0A6B0TCC2_9EURY|nr:heme o synthase [Halovenus carboxidivorans]MXR52881.1 protoheme IX farnesyltransferase [Halovenus carboxidivorans]